MNKVDFSNFDKTNLLFSFEKYIPKEGLKDMLFGGILIILILFLEILAGIHLL